MIVEQIYTENSLRNFNYIIACEDTLEAIVVDPLKVDAIMDLADSKKYKITKIVNTHDHADHTDGNKDLVSKTGAEVFCHHNALETIPCAKHGLVKDDILTVGTSVSIKVLDTPGHTMAHVCLLASDVSSKYNSIAILSGDTLFNAGAGNVYSGNVESLYKTFTDILYKLPDETLVYPGHDYLENNLQFTLSREPSNVTAKDLLSEIKNQDPHNPLVTTLGLEKKMNTFFRLDSEEVIDCLTKDYKGFASNPQRTDVFFALRDLRNSW